MLQIPRRKLWLIAIVTVLLVAFTMVWGAAVGAPLDVTVIAGTLGVVLLAAFEEFYVQRAAGAWLRNLRMPVAVPIYAAVLCAILFAVQHAAHYATGRTAELAQAYERLPLTIPLVFVSGMIGVAAYRAIGVVIAERVDAAALARELEIARDIQLSMLPDPARLKAMAPDIDVAAVLAPAGSVGGDMFDAFMLGDDRLYFMVGDVAGKGVPAALFMSAARMMSSAIMLHRGEDLAVAVNIMNTELTRQNQAHELVAALFGVVHLKTGVVDLCNAGHENPVILRTDGRIAEHAMKGGPPLCVVEDFAYEAEPVTLRRDDILVAFTDGVTEARAPDGEFLGRPGTLASLRGSRPACAADAAGRLVDAARAFEAGGERKDDLTVLAVRYRGNGLVSD